MQNYSKTWDTCMASLTEHLWWLLAHLMTCLVSFLIPAAQREKLHQEGAGVSPRNVGDYAHKPKSCPLIPVERDGVGGDESPLRKTA